MGTGTAAIAIAIASEKPQWNITASDISKQAIALATKNCQHHHALYNTANIHLIHSNWFDNIKHNNFDIIVSNPPYIATDDPHLQQGDVRFEPISALISGINGMDDIEHLTHHAGSYLKKNGWLIIEHGYNQKQQTKECFAKNNFINIEQKQDLSSQTRVTAGQKSD